jgi:hypothetical protein
LLEVARSSQLLTFFGVKAHNIAKVLVNSSWGSAPVVPRRTIAVYLLIIASFGVIPNEAEV